MTNIFKKLLLVIFITSLISSCSKKEENFEIDISKLNLPKKSISNEVIDIKDESEQDEILYKLKTLKDKKEVMDNIKYGKNDPFATTENDSRKLIADFKIDGFISINEKNYALVSYQEKKGVININSVGGSNTNLIPDKSFIKEINPQKEEITISFLDEIYNIRIGDE